LKRLARGCVARRSVVVGLWICALSLAAVLCARSVHTVCEALRWMLRQQ
jgi:hypothetical protein